MEQRSTRLQVLQILIDARRSGSPVSGAVLADKLGLSRNAVWKAINSLKSEGYDIISEQSRGYMLGGPADMLSSDEILRLAKGSADSDIEVTVLDTVDSTNTYARSLPVTEGEQLIVSDEQTGGRGRFGRNFYSPKGTGIYMTYVFTPEFPLDEVALVTAITATVVRDTLERVAGPGFAIKWVNDTYKNGLKVSGILTEAVGGLESGNFERIIIGIGINCYRSSIPEDLVGIAGCVSDEDDPGFTRNEIIAGVLQGLHTAFAGRTRLNASAYLENYRDHCFIIGQQVDVARGKDLFPARVDGINDRFELLVTPEGETEQVTLSSGEVSIRL